MFFLNRIARTVALLTLLVAAGAPAARDPRIHPMTIPTSSTAGMKMKCPAVTTSYRPPAIRCAWRNSASTRPSRRHSIRT